MGELTKIGEADLQDLLPGHRDWRKERDAAAAKKVEKLMETFNKGLSGDALYLAQILIRCGLPVEPTDESQVVRETRTATGEDVKVTFSRVDKNIPLPYGKDRNMVMFLTNMSVVSKSTLLDWRDINEYIELFSQCERSGLNHKRAQARFIRVAHMNITVAITKYVDGVPVTETRQVPLLDITNIPGAVDQETGKWVVKATPKKMLVIANGLRVGTEFYARFLAPKKSVPVPIELVMEFANQPRLLDYALFLFYRCFAAQSETTITWDQLRRQFDDRDPNLRQWRYKFRQVVTRMRCLGHPFDLTDVLVMQNGVRLKPYPEGTEFIPGQPKRKFLPSSVAE